MLGKMTKKLRGELAIWGYFSTQMSAEARIGN
jgi:hypothetical protein